MSLCKDVRARKLSMSGDATQPRGTEQPEASPLALCTIMLSTSDAYKLVLDSTDAGYFLLAVLMICIYDAVITMDKEIEYFWKIPRKVVVVFYFANRYIGIIGAATPLARLLHEANNSICKFEKWTSHISYWISIALINYIVVVRVLALYSQSRRLSIYLKTLLVFASAFVLGLAIYNDLNSKVSAVRLSEVAIVCFSLPVPLQWEIVMWSIPVTGGALLLVRSIYKVYKYQEFSFRQKISQLTRILVRDHLLYFVLVCICCILNNVLFAVTIENILLSNFVAFFASPSLLSVIGSRMMFNLKDAAEENTYTTPFRTMSPMQFDGSELGNTQEGDGLESPRDREEDQ